MKVTGFTFIRNAVKFEYPIKEVIQSMLPLCDEVIVAVGNSDDGTLELVSSISPKVKIINTVWDDTLREGGRVLAVETDKAYNAISEDSDWCIYMQGDEMLHEQDYEVLKSAMLKYKDDKQVDGLLLKYYHFYGSYDYIAAAPNWCRREVRVLRKDKAIYSYSDALGFRKSNNEKLKVKPVDATVYHYGWVRPPKTMQEKLKTFHKMWHDDNWVQQHVPAGDFDYSQIDALNKFTGTHPKVMQERISRINWQFDRDMSRNSMKFKYRLRLFIEKLTGITIGEFRNYKVI
jgi:glycosyltransferase involved in cell wall biosynthesis